MIHTYDSDGARGSIEEAFRYGEPLLVPWSEATRNQVLAAMSAIAGYLAKLPATLSFGGINQLEADRQTLWAASTGLGRPFHLQRDELARFDGDTEGGERGLEALLRDNIVRHSMEILKGVLDNGLQIAARGIGLDDDLPPELAETITVRYRAIRYAPVDRDVAGIGLHPDGNVLSALLTDQTGLVITDRDGVYRPTNEGTIVMPGSILYRWSNGYFQPTFHSVEIRRGDATKFSIVAFLNFPDHTLIPRNARRQPADPFFNDVQRCKEDDMNREGDLAPLWHSL